MDPGGGVDILDGIGSTEMLHIFLSNQPGDVRYGTSGRAVPGYDLRVVDADGAPVPDGEPGELLVRGDSAADGYWNQRAKSRRTFQGEWTWTGDKYIREPDGYYRYCGRSDDMFKVSGIWVSPFEVEGALVSHPAVLEAAVVGHADDQGLTKPRAFVVLKAGGGGHGGDVADPCEDQGGSVEISPLDRFRRRSAEDGHRQDPTLQAAGLADDGTTGAAQGGRPRAGGRLVGTRSR